MYKKFGLSLIFSFASLYGAASSSASSGVQDPSAVDWRSFVTNCLGAPTTEARQGKHFYSCIVFPEYSKTHPLHGTQADHSSSRYICPEGNYLTAVQLKLLYGTDETAVKFMAKQITHRGLVEFDRHDVRSSSKTDASMRENLTLLERSFEEWIERREQSYLQTCDGDQEKLAKATNAEVFTILWRFSIKNGSGGAGYPTIRKVVRNFTKLTHEYEFFARPDGSESITYERALSACDRPELLMTHFDQEMREGLTKCMQHLKKSEDKTWRDIYEEMLVAYCKEHRPSLIEDKYNLPQIMLLIDTPAIIALLKGAQKRYRRMFNRWQLGQRRKRT